jgi:hypothetical protein
MRPEWEMTEYATHLPLLAACVAHTTGPVLELGCGAYSTPLLHALCVGRPLLSIENDPFWFSQFDHLGVGRHVMRLVHCPWEEVDLGGPYDVALIDHTPPLRRVREIERLRGKVRLIVAHDTENRCYCYEPVLTTFAYRVEWQRYAPWVSVVSDEDDLSWLKPALY